MTCAKGFEAFLVMGQSSSPIVSILVVHFLAIQIVAQRMIQTAVIIRDGLTSVADFDNIFFIGAARLSTWLLGRCNNSQLIIHL
jgi:hypothetical protein